jgi:assimilatory nitrate reductase catalytic subunit
MLADDTQSAPAIADILGKVGFKAVVASYVSSVTAIADVVLPALPWTETAGSYTTLDGISKTARPLLSASPGMLSNLDVMNGIARCVKSAHRKE